ncbi:MAG TPA: phosphoglucomutase/phosphomannomutase family protein [bacterium]|nr:phosphoglucomutase/phosphomannomutase family protein [bacterium]
MDEIKFGTDGWRARMDGAFTVPNVRRVAQGLGRALKARSRVFIGYDTRKDSPLFARSAAEVLAALGHKVILASRSLPTPALSLAVKDQRAAAGVMITASHNQGAYNGFKVKLFPGVSAPREFTQRIEKGLPKLPPSATAKRSLPKADWLGPYLRTLREKVDLKALKGSGFRVVVDSMHGVGERHFERLVASARTRVWTIAAQRSDDFGGRQPEPIGPNLGPLSKAIRSRKAQVGFATDGDGDRIGMMDEKGRFVDVHKLHAILLYHLWVHRGMRGGVVKTVSGTLMIERMAKELGAPLDETSIGFKHIGAVMLKKDILLGLEESGGIAFKGHLPERDGLLSALYLMEALVTMGKKVSEVVGYFQEKYGPFHYDRSDLGNVPAERQAAILARVRKAAPSRIAGHRVTGVQALDGVKLKLEKGWVLLRSSGTEPLLRLYAEAPSIREVKALLGAAKKLALTV